MNGLRLSELETLLNQRSGTRNFLEAVFNSLSTIVVVLDLEGKILFFNRQAEIVTGYAFHEVENRHLQDLFLLPEEKQEVMRVFDALNKGNYPNRHQNFWMCRDGSVRRIDWANNVLEDSNGGILYIIGMGLDVTDDYEKTRLLLEAEERFESVFRQNPLAMALLRYPDGLILDVNIRFVSLLELDPISLIGQPVHVLKLLHENEVDKHGLLVHFTAPNFWNSERTILTGANRLLHVAIHMEFVSVAGQPCLLMTVQDYTERIRSQERITQFTEELENKILERTAALDAINRELKAEVSFRKAIESSSQRLVEILWETTDIVAISDNQGRIIYLNKAGRKIFGMNDVESVSHMLVYDAYSREMKAKILTEIQPALQQASIWYGELEITLHGEHGDRVIPVSQVIIAHRNDAGEVEFYSSIARDITDQKRAADEIKRAYQKEVELSQLRSNFFSMTSHQFRTPLSTILSSVELLEHYGGKWSSEKRDNHLKKIKDATQDLTTMLNDILELSRIDARTGNLQLEAIDLRGVIDKLVQQFNQLDRDSHPMIVTGDAGEYILHSDRLAVERTLENLLSNAVKYSPSGSPITLKVARLSKGFRVGVRDQGIGISEDDLKLVFEPFHRGSNVIDMPGSGIGLMIVKKSLELINGKIDIHSKPEEGTEIVVDFPDLR